MSIKLKPNYQISIIRQNNANHLTRKKFAKDKFEYPTQLNKKSQNAISLTECHSQAVLKRS